jgi:AcrR family transcriptional regulator
MARPQVRSEPRWTRRKEARPEEITAAALELFIERGYAATRLEDIAARAGVSKGTLYLYFANKEEIFKAVVREGIGSPIKEFAGAIESFTGSSFDLLDLMIRTWWERIGSTRLSGIPKLVMSEAQNFPEIARFYVEEVVRPGREALGTVIRRGMARGEFRPLDPRHAGNLVFAPLLMISMWRNSLHICAPEEVDPLGLLDAHLATLRRGFAAHT